MAALYLFQKGFQVALYYKENAEISYKVGGVGVGVEENRKVGEEKKKLSWNDKTTSANPCVLVFDQI